MLILAIACIFALILGFAAHRASVCTVRAIAEITSTHAAHMLASIGKSSMWVVAVTLPFFWLMPTAGMGLSGWPLTSFALLGGFLFGVGAAVNGACAYSTMARLVDGEGGMLMTIAGFAIGVLVFVALVDLHWLSRPIPVPTVISMLTNWAWLIGGIFLLWALYEAARLWRTRPNRAPLTRLIIARQYRLSSAAMVIGLSGAVIFLLIGSPGYTATLQNLIEGYVGAGSLPSITRWVLLIAVLLGMALSTLQRGSFRIDWRPRLAWFRNIIGGMLMGFGTALLPGGNDALVLYGIPALSPHAVPAFLTLAVGVGVGLSAMRRVFGVEMTVSCRNDVYVTDTRTP
jgi:uncharacterized protein